MTDGRGRWRKTVALAALLTIGIAGSARRAEASTIGVTDATKLRNLGQFDWGALGPSFSNVPNGFTTPVPGVKNLNLTGTGAGGGDFVRIDQGDWPGNFGPGETLLWSFFSGPLTFTFNSAITGFGAQIQADDLGPFTARIEAFNAGNTSLGVFTEAGVSNGNGDDSAIFLGILSNTADIRKITVSLTTSGGGSGDPTDFAINSPIIQDVPVPEPATLVLVGTGVAGVLARRRKR